MYFSVNKYVSISTTYTSINKICLYYRLHLHNTSSSSFVQHLKAFYSALACIFFRLLCFVLYQFYSLYCHCHKICRIVATGMEMYRKENTHAFRRENSQTNLTSRQFRFLLNNRILSTQYSTLFSYIAIKFLFILSSTQETNHLSKTMKKCDRIFKS